MSRKLTIPLLLLCALSSCTQPTYVANKLQVPIFTHADEKEIEASYNLFGSAHVAAGYAITDEIAAVGSCRFSKFTAGDSESYHSNFYDIGAGYYRKPSDDEIFRFEVFGRIGYGYMKTIDTDEEPFSLMASDGVTQVGFFSYDYWKSQVQINTGISYENISLIGSLRTGFMHLGNISRRIQRTDDGTVVEQSFEANRNIPFFDYGFTARVETIYRLGIELQVGGGKMSKTIGFSGSEKYPIFSFGLTYKF
ncbi:MAG TPA: hypothetical protein VIX80_03545 [Candidatus Kapabacteria bacterium]